MTVQKGERPFKKKKIEFEDIRFKFDERGAKVWRDAGRFISPRPKRPEIADPADWSRMNI